MGLNSENKTVFNIQNPGEKTVVAADIVRLQDKSRQTILTDSPEQFIELYDGELRFGSDVPPMVLATTQEVKLWESEEPNAYKEPSAILKLAAHPRLKRVLAANRQNMRASEATDFLKSLRNNIDENGSIVLMKSRDFKVSRKHTITEKRDESGQFNIMVAAEGKIEDNWTPPASVKFTVPVYEHIPLCVTLELDFSVVIKEPEDKEKGCFEAFFKFESLNLEEDLLAARRAVLTEWLTKVRKDGSSLQKVIDPAHFIWGSLEIKHKNDMAELVQNRFDGVSLVR